MAGFKTVWMVTKPTEYSELVDICFDIKVERIGYQFIGGLKPEEVVSIHTEEASAKREARALLRKRGPAKVYVEGAK